MESKEVVLNVVLALIVVLPLANAGRANLCLAVVDTIIVEDANDLAG